jgi:hypothetical protein
VTQPPPWPAAPGPTPWSAPAPGWGPPPGSGWDTSGQGTPGWPPPPKPPGNAGWIVALVAAVVVVVVLAVAGGVIAFVVSTKAPIDATNKVLREVRRGDYAAAYRDSCSANQLAYSPFEFRRAWEAEIADRGRITTFDVGIDGGHAGSGSHKVVDTTIDFADGSSITFRADVYQEQGTWRPCLLSNR